MNDDWWKDFVKDTNRTLLAVGLIVAAWLTVAVSVGVFIRIIRIIAGF